MKLFYIFILFVFSFGFPARAQDSTQRDAVITQKMNELEANLEGDQAPAPQNTAVQNTAVQNTVLPPHFASKDFKQDIVADQIPPEGQKTAPKPAPYKTFIHRFYISAAYDANHIHYSEWDGLNKLDEDIGTQRGMYYAAGYRSPNYINIRDWLMGKPFIEAYYYHSYRTRIEYKGAFIGGGAVNFKEGTRIDQAGAKIGGYYDNFLGKGEVYGYLDGGKRVWNRGENVGANYHEKYYWVYTGFGAGMNYPFLSRLSAGLDGEVLFAISPKMYSDLDQFTFKLGSVWGTEVKAPIKLYLLKNLSFDVTPYFIYWKIQASRVAPDGMYEPVSKTHEEGLLSGMTYTF